MATRKTPSKTGARTAAKAGTKTAPTARKRSSAAPAKTLGPSEAVSRAALPAAAVPAETRATTASVPTGEARYRWIAHAAYLRAEKRGFAPGEEIDDWLAAEAEFNAAFKAG